MSALIVNAEWDEDARVWVATSEDIPGLVTEADSLEDLGRKVRDLVPELLAENSGPFPEGRAPMVELVARQQLAISV
jgi:hypothetical protein